MILMAKSEIRPTHVWEAGENRVCRGTGLRKNDFAISIKNADDPQNADAVCRADVLGFQQTRRLVYADAVEV
jgi:hypothetical protein